MGSTREFAGELISPGSCRFRSYQLVEAHPISPPKNSTRTDPLFVVVVPHRLVRGAISNGVGSVAAGRRYCGT